MGPQAQKPCMKCSIDFCAKSLSRVLQIKNSLITGELRLACMQTCLEFAAAGRSGAFLLQKIPLARMIRAT
jgi:hypothetical protein